MTLTATFEAALHVQSSAYVSPQTVVVLPPSTLDPAADQMRVVVNGVQITRQYDPAMEQP